MQPDGRKKDESKNDRRKKDGQAGASIKGKRAPACIMEGPPLHGSVRDALPRRDAMITMNRGTNGLHRHSWRPTNLGQLLPSAAAQLNEFDQT